MPELVQTLLIVCPLVFLGGFVDSVAGGGGLITLPAYMMAGVPVHFAAGTNKVVNGCGSATASVKFFRSGKIRLHAARRRGKSGTPAPMKWGSAWASACSSAATTAWWAQVPAHS